MAQKNVRSQYRPVTRGLCRAVVEDNFDPEGLNRLRVRIPSLHGHPQTHGDNCIPNDKLPWAEMSSFSAGPGRGTSIVPNKGDYVWITFEEGDRQKPVVLGCFYTSAPTANKKTFDNSGMKEVSRDKSAPNESTPQSTADKVTSAQVLYKSKKGAEIGFYEEDQKETFRIIDSLGQILEFGSHSPEGSPARSSGDRTRKPVKPDGVYGQGYILIQIAGDDIEDGFQRNPGYQREEKVDPKFFLSPDTIHIENGRSKISAYSDHISIHNTKGAIDFVGANIKISNNKSSIDILSPNKDDDEKGDVIEKDEDETIAITNGSGCTMVLGGKTMSIRVDKDIFIQAEGSITIGAEKDIGILAGNNMSIGAGNILSMSSGSNMFINSGANITEIASGVIIMRATIINLN